MLHAIPRIATAVAHDAGTACQLGMIVTSGPGMESEP
jgi:hypothetical protein